jgi:hypothetical protein
MTPLVRVLVATAVLGGTCESRDRRAEREAWQQVTEVGPAYAEKVIECLRTVQHTRFPRSCYARGDEELNVRIVAYFDACFQCTSQQRCKVIAADNKKILIAETFRRYPPAERTQEMKRLLMEVGVDGYTFACE